MSPSISATLPVGLSNADVIRRRRQYGENSFTRNRVTALAVLWRQFASSLSYLLMLAVLFSFWLGDHIDGSVILIILLLNAGLGFAQEYKSERTAEKLRGLIHHQVLVQREGKSVLVEQRQLVPGDLVIVKEGDVVPADLTLLSSEGLQVNEAQLTGESLPIDKNLKSKRQSQLFMGSVVERGEGRGLITAIANQTELGKLATLSQNTRKVTQYEKSLQAFSSLLIRITLFTLLLVFITKLGLSGSLAQASVYFIFIIALAVSVVPEAMPVIATVTLASGALRLAKRHVVVKKLSSLEDLGNVTLLCTDKTGTLTENSLKIRSITSPQPELLQVLAAAAIEHMDAKRKRAVTSLDQALQEYVPAEIRVQVRHFRIVQEIPFDPEARRRRVVLEDQRDHSHYLLVSGSAETLLQLGRTPHKQKYLDQLRAEGQQGLRHFAYAYKKITYSVPFDIPAHEKNLTLLGFLTLEDPLRPGIKATLELAKQLGIGIKILTGDSVEVAEYVGRQLGLLKSSERVYTGSELEKLGREELRRVLPNASIFARVTPSQKYQLIELLKETQVVAYQGDGINDAPSLKLADVGIAVSHATDVAKESADIILLRPDLSVIINGIRYGRAIFVNINKYLKYTMVGNFGNFFALAGLFLIGSQLPLLPIQLLLTSLLTDIPLIAIASDTVDSPEVIRPTQHNLRQLFSFSLVLGVLTMLFEFMFFSLVRLNSTAATQTIFFLYLTLLQLAVIFLVRNRGHFWRSRLPSWELSGGIILVALMAIWLPFNSDVGRLFSFVPLGVVQIGTVILMVAVYLLFLDLVKVGYYRVVGLKNF